MNEFEFNAASISPSGLFEGRMFRVPDYQRGYAWEKEQLDEFLEDLDLLSLPGVHYFGNIVLHNANDDHATDKGGNSYGIFDVVDGQQRLTTLVLLLDAIRREFAGFEHEALAEGIYGRYIAVTGGNGQMMPRLTLNSDCHRFYFEHVLHDTASLDGQKMRSHRNLSFAKKHFEKYLTKMRGKNRAKHPEWLKELRHKVCDQLVLTIYPVQKDADAGVIFEVMNNRGKPISQMEKVKNYLLYSAAKLDLREPHDLAKRVNDTWTHIYTRLMASGLGREEHENQLLRVHWLMAHDPAEKMGDRAKSLKEEFHLRDYKGRHDELLVDLLKYVSTLCDATTAYCDVVHPYHADAFNDLLSDESIRDKVIEASDKLRRLNVVAPFLPFLVALRMTKPGRGATYLRAVKLCEIFAFRVYRLLDKKSNAGRAKLFQLAHKLYTFQSTLGEAIHRLIDLIKEYSPPGDVNAELEAREGWNWYDWSGLKYFLYEYETHLCELRNKSSKFSWKQLEKAQHSVEHILPQNPSARYWGSRWTQEQRDLYTNDFGNLCLTLDNSSYGNKPFPEKRGEAGTAEHCYANGDLVMERELAAFSDWDLTALLKRRAEMAEWAKERWALPAKQEP